MPSAVKEASTEFLIMSKVCSDIILSIQIASLLPFPLLNPN